MNDEVLNVAQRRQAIQRGLKHYFQGSSLEHALSYWEQEYSEKPAFVLNRFLNEICITDDLKLHRKEMLKHVIHELTHLEKAELIKVDQKNDFVASDHLHRAYEEFVDCVLRKVQPEDVSEFANELKQQLINDHLFTQSVDQYLSSEALMRNIEMLNGSKAITALYRVYCDFYGPQKTDRIYAQAKTEIKQHYPDVDLHQLL